MLCFVFPASLDDSEGYSAFWGRKVWIHLVRFAWRMCAQMSDFFALSVVAYDMLPGGPYCRYGNR